MRHFRPYAQALAMTAALVAGGGCSPATSTGNASPAPGTPLPTIAPVAPETLTAQAEDSAQSDLTLLSGFRGDVQPQAQAIFGLTGEQGDTVRIEVRVRLGSPDILLELSTPGGEVLASVNVGGPGQSEAIGEFRFPADGYYELAVQSLEGAGQVDVLIYRLTGESLSGGGVIPGFDQPVTGAMYQPATFHTFQFQAERGQRFDLKATALSGDLDLLFELYNPQGEPVARRDDSLGFDPYLFNYMPPTSGQYTLVLTNYEQTTGTYQIVTSLSHSSGQLGFGRQQLISLPTEPHHGVWLTFIGTAGDGLSVSAEPANPNTDLTLAIYDVFGNRLAYANLGGSGADELLGRVQLPYDGPYQLEFGTLSEGGQVRYDAFERTQFDFDTGGPLLSFPTMRNVTLLETGTVHVYWFEGQEGQRVTLDATTTAGTLDLAFDLYDQAGNLLSSRDDDRGKDPVLENFPLPFSGRYYLVLRVEGTHRGGQYRLTADTPPPPDQAREAG